MEQQRYPDSTMDFAPSVPPEWRCFADAREEALVNYGYNTARAYWADLQDWFEWAEARGKNVLALDDQDKRQYFSLLRRRGYSESTVKRRRVSLGLLGKAADRLASSGEAISQGQPSV